MSTEAFAALASDSWDEVCRGLDMLVAMNDKKLWARLAEGVWYTDGKVSIAENVEIARIMGPTHLKSTSGDKFESVQRLGHVVVALHALFNGRVADVREFSSELIDDLHPLLRLPSLEKLDVRGDDVDIEPLGRLAALQDLTVRRFAGLYYEPGLSVIGALPRLRSLHIDLACGSFSPSGLTGIEILRDHPTIQELCFDWCNITEEDLPIIASIPHLHSLDLWYADNLEDYRLIRGAIPLKNLTLDIGGRNYGGLACMAHLFERGGLELTDGEPAGVTSAVDLSPLESLSPAAVAELQRSDQSLVLNGLRVVSARDVEALAENGRNLYLDRLESLDRNVAENLSRHTGYLSLRGLQKLEKDAAQLMAGRNAWFCMALPDSLDVEVRTALRENRWYISPEECHWRTSTSSPALWRLRLPASTTDRTALSPEAVPKVRALLDSGEENALSLAIVLMSHADSESWRSIFDSASIGILAETWNPMLYRQFCELCPGEDELQEFVVAVARRLAAKSLEVDEPSEHADLFESLDCEDTPDYLRELLRLQVPSPQDSIDDEDDASSDANDDEESDGDDDEADEGFDESGEDDESEQDEVEAAIVSTLRQRPWFL